MKVKSSMETKKKNVIRNLALYQAQKLQIFMYTYVFTLKHYTVSLGIHIILPNL